MGNGVMKPLYILVGLLFIIILGEGYFIYDLKKESVTQKREFPLTSATTSRSVAPASNYVDPFIEIQKIQENMIREFGNFNSMLANDPFFKGVFSSTPMSAHFDIVEKDKEYMVEIKIPGVERKNIEVKSEGNMIHVSAQSQNINEKKDANYIHKESYGDYFQRSFSMPDDADLKSMKSDYKDGVLKLFIQKKNS